MSTRTAVSPVALIGIVAIGICWAEPAFAYIDPGSGSMILQGILATIAAAGVGIAGCWTRVRSFFAGRRQAEREDDRASETRERT